MIDYDLFRLSYLLTITVRLQTIEAFCGEPGCKKYFTNKQCLKTHIQSCHQHIICEICGVKASHLQEKLYVCSISGCGMSFSFKHVRDNHEKSGKHVYTVRDFVEADDKLQSRPRGGAERKRFKKMLLSFFMNIISVLYNYYLCLNVKELF
ncbi:putative transcription factor C2H2 family [Helianthus annuus]|nr:putative transcription factor C2H2 family [Helianthus annuus]KAJ0446398.1 putative transcription factor C2H2 family [Helianthus annuus]KAJ0824984.1 putative transcription factor C2H2 family [Helianthus annuus]